MKTLKRKVILSLLVLATVLSFGVFGLTTSSNNKVFADIEVGFKMQNGASIRLVENSNGMRFTAQIDTDTYDSFVEGYENVECGTFIMPSDYVTRWGDISYDTCFGQEAIYTDAEEVPAGKHGIIRVMALLIEGDGYNYIKGSVYDVKPENLSRSYTAKSYIKAYNTDADAKYKFADANNNPRSMIEVVVLAINDGSEYTGANKDIIDGYITAYDTYCQENSVSKPTADYKIENYYENLSGVYEKVGESIDGNGEIATKIEITDKTPKGAEASYFAYSSEKEADTLIAIDGSSIAKAYFARKIFNYKVVVKNGDATVKEVPLQGKAGATVTVSLPTLDNPELILDEDKINQLGSQVLNADNLEFVINVKEKAPLNIATKDDFLTFIENGGNAVLTDDITYTVEEFKYFDPANSLYSVYKELNGKLEGNNHTINITIPKTTDAVFDLFNTVNANITNVKFVIDYDSINSSLFYSAFTHALKGSVKNCIFDITYSSAYMGTGNYGIIEDLYGTVENCVIRSNGSLARAISKTAQEKSCIKDVVYISPYTTSYGGTFKFILPGNYCPNFSNFVYYTSLENASKGEGYVLTGYAQDNFSGTTVLTNPTSVAYDTIVNGFGISSSGVIFPTSISNAEEFLTFIENGGYAVLTDDITYTVEEFPNAANNGVYKELNGKLEGNNHTINITVPKTTDVSFNLFNTVNADIKNVKFVIDYDSKNYESLFFASFARSLKGSVKNCIFDITYSSAYMGTGNYGLIEDLYGTVENCVIRSNGSFARAISKTAQEKSCIKDVVYISPYNTSYGGTFKFILPDNYCANFSNFVYYTSLENASKGEGYVLTGYAEDNFSGTTVLTGPTSVAYDTIVDGFGILASGVNFPTSISNAEEFEALISNSGYGVLANDIEVTLSSSTVGGNTYFSTFSGILDGNGHKVTITLELNKQAYEKGLIGEMTGTIKNINLDITATYDAANGDSSIFINYCSGTIKNSVISYVCDKTVFPIYRTCDTAGKNGATIENVMFVNKNTGNIGKTTPILTKAFYGAKLNNVVCICDTAYATNSEFRALPESDANIMPSELNNLVIYSSLANAGAGNGYALKCADYIKDTACSPAYWEATTDSASTVLGATATCGGISVDNSGNITITPLAK